MSDAVEWTDVSYGHRRAMATCRQTGAQVVGQWRLGAVPDADRKAARDALAVLTGQSEVCHGTAQSVVEWRPATTGEGGGVIAEAGDYQVAVRARFGGADGYTWIVAEIRPLWRNLRGGYCPTEEEAKRVAEAVLGVLA